MAIRHIHDRFLMDDHSYICEPYSINGSMAVLHVGKYCSIAASSVWDLGFQHNYKNVTTFPLHIKKEGILSNVWVKGDIILQNDIWCGNGITVMGGVTIHNGAVIGAGAIVRRDIMPYEIYTGSKKPEKYRFDHVTINKLLKIAWWDWPEERVLANAELLASQDIENFINNHI